MSVILPSAANAAAVSEYDVFVETPDGLADCYFVLPNEGQHAAVLLWPDVLGLRPAFRMMGTFQISLGIERTLLTFQ